MYILLVGPFFANKNHGAEQGIYDALIELGHRVWVADLRTNQFMKSCNIRPFSPVDSLSLESPISQDFDFILCPGPGFSEQVYESSWWKSLHGAKIIWNSEPIRLPSYKNRMIQNKGYFDYFFTFDESEIPLYKELGIEAKWLPQAANPKWYYPLGNSPTKDLCFVGSFGPKWKNREYFINRLRKAFSVDTYTIFDATQVNRIYNEYKIALNLGLYLEELGPIHCLKARAFTQRIFESYLSGRVCVSHEMEHDYFGFLENNKNILFYNKDNLEAVIKYALDDMNRKRLEQNILSTRDSHTYKNRIKEMFNVI